MRYSTEHQRNIAFDLLWMRRNDLFFDNYFKTGEPVIIYGFDFLGREFYQEIKDCVNVLCFIDRAHDGECFDNVKIFSLQNQSLYKEIESYQEIKVIIMILSDQKSIVADIKNRITNATPVSVYSIFAQLKIQSEKFIDKKSKYAISIVKDILENKKTSIRNIVLIGTPYTELLSMLYLENWKDSLFIAERYVPIEIVEKMEKYGIACLYENEPVECYDLCYMISEYAAKWNIPVLGHDHMQLSRAFLENGITVIEDGNANYDICYAINYPITLDDGRKYLSLGYDDLVKKVVLTGIHNIPVELSGKEEIIKPSALWKQKTEKEREMISDIFSFPYTELLECIAHGRDILFLTEPSISNGEVVMTEEEQIAEYKKILSNYPEDKILIKPHPADIIDYEYYMPQYKVINKRFPVQMIEWADIKINRMVMIWGTTCINSFSERYIFDIYKDGILI